MATDTTTFPTEKIKIDSSQLFVDTGIQIVKDVTYYYQATGQWKDSLKATDAEGYNSLPKKPHQHLLRKPNATFLKLIGTIDKKDFFEMGRSGTFTSKVSGQLFCFANDLPKMYWNNHDSIDLQISDKPFTD